MDFQSIADAGRVCLSFSRTNVLVRMTSFCKAQMLKNIQTKPMFVMNPDVDLKLSNVVECITKIMLCTCIASAFKYQFTKSPLLSSAFVFGVGGGVCFERCR